MTVIILRTHQIELVPAPAAPAEPAIGAEPSADPSPVEEARSAPEMVPFIDTFIV